MAISSAMSDLPTEAAVGLASLVVADHVLDAVRQRLHHKGFCQHPHARREVTAADDGVLRIARDEQNLELRPRDARRICQLTTVDAAGQADIAIASITTPAWTSLFAMASAVVTDVGGPLSHSSIVAREYGIPAVLGTNVATRRIPDGARVRVDGDAGTVTLLDGDGSG